MFPEEGSLGIFQPIIGSWYESLGNPQKSQRRVLLDLAKGYEKTRYGKSHHASEIEEITDFRANFPIIDYRKLNPYLAEVQKGDYATILPEPLVCWVMTRGSTGPAKVLPATKTHLEQIFTCGARALINYALRKRDFELLTG
ncbi:MAG: GH3 auxin-responsive promoter family protein, partial [Candidatus Hodarchaeota archaeon]